MTQAGNHEKIGGMAWFILSNLSSRYEYDLWFSLFRGVKISAAAD